MKNDQQPGHTDSDPLDIQEDIFRKGFWTVPRKLTAIMTILTTISFLTIVLFSGNYLKTRMTNMAKENYTVMTQLLADTSAAAFRWNKASQVEALFDRAVLQEGSTLIAMSAQGLPQKAKSLNAMFRIDDKAIPELEEQVRAASLENGDTISVIESGSFLIIKLPVRMKPDTPSLGNLVTVWSTTEIHQAVRNDIRTIYLLGAVSVVLLGIMLGVAVRHGIGRPIAKVVAAVEKISKGNLDSDLKVHARDELGELIFALNKVQLSLRAGDDSKRRAAEFGRIKQALDCATVSTMLADSENNIVYVNRACEKFLEANSPIISDPQASMSANQLIGQSVDVLAADCKISSSSLSCITTNEKLEVHHAGLTLQINVTPVLDSEGSRLGTVIEWVDKTRQSLTEKQVQLMVDAAAEGDFTHRIDTSSMDGFYAQIATMLNRLATISEAGLNDTLQVLKSLARGQLNSRIGDNHMGIFAELRENCNQTSDTLTDIVKQIRETCLCIDEGANEIAKGNADLSTRTEQQAAQLQNTSAAMAEMSETVQNNSDLAREANSIANNARTDAERGRDVAAKAVDAVHEISSASSEIADIISVIDGIAFQTNLLALNASVEAARAGDKGSGFAVVASEVRALAGRSAAAASEIKDLIKDSVDKVTEGEKLVGESGEVLEAIVGSVNKVTDIVSEMAAAGLDQSKGIGQINESVTQIDEATQRNATLVEVAARTSQKVDQHAKHLGELVSFFATDDKDPVADDIDTTKRAA